ncbi:MAG: nuclear transport factor 2 family protein [Gemmatimonadetes bacterium]|nr:nuclear transport factor 2 family protein [Gemmatimonadota bacterium]
MKAIFAGLVLILTACAPKAPAPQVLTEAQRTAIADTVKRLANELFEAENRLDADVFISQATDDPDFRYVSSGNLFPSKDSLSKAAHARVKSLKALTYTLKDGGVTVLSPDAATFTGAYDETAVDSTGKTLTFRDGWTAVYARRNGQWKIVHGHFSRAPVPAAPVKAGGR